MLYISGINPLKFKPMSTNSESGIASNLGNFQIMTGLCQGFGSKYNPFNPLIKLDALNGCYQLATESVNAVKEAKPPADRASDERSIVFTPLSDIVTASFNSLRSCGASSQVIADIRPVVYKLLGRRISAVKGETEPVTPEEPGAGASKTISASQQSFNSKIDFMATYIEALKNEPKYSPNEEPLKITSLTALLGRMKDTNQTVVDTTAPLVAARSHRNQVFNHPETGLVAIASLVKKYVKSVYKPQSMEYKKIGGLGFVKIRE